MKKWYNLVLKDVQFCLCAHEHTHVCAHAQSCPARCNPMDPPDSSVGFFRQEYWGWLPFPPLGDLPDPGIEPTSLVSPALAGGFFTSLARFTALQL